MSVAGLGGGTAISLPRSGDRDWIVVGGRQDGMSVRAKAGTGEIVSVVPEGGSPVVANGPLRISWAGGAPEQDHIGTPTWWALSGSAGFRIDVRPVRSCRIDVYLGALGAPLTMTATSFSSGTQNSSSVVVPASPASVVTVDVPDPVAGGAVSLWIPGSGPGAGVAIAAVAVH